MKQQDWVLTSFKKMILKAVNTKAKAGLKSSIMVRDTDFYYSRNYYLSSNISAKVQTQSSIVKKSKPKESRLKNLKPANKITFALSYINKLEKTFYQDKKKEYFKKKWNQKNFIPAIKDNAIKDKKKQNNQSNKKCYNCQKKAILPGTT